MRRRVRNRRDTARDYIAATVTSFTLRAVAPKMGVAHDREEGTTIGTKQTISEGGVSDEHCAPDTVSPAQFHEMWAGTPDRSAEFKLALAVLEQAIEDLRRHRGASAPEPQRLYVQARRWVASNDRRWPYSFLNVCDMLNLSCGRMRTRLLAETAAPLDVVGAAVPVEIIGSADVDLHDDAPLDEELQRLARA